MKRILLTCLFILVTCTCLAASISVQVGAPPTVYYYQPYVTYAPIPQIPPLPPAYYCPPAPIYAYPLPEHRRLWYYLPDVRVVAPGVRVHVGGHR